MVFNPLIVMALTFAMMVVPMGASLAFLLLAFDDRGIWSRSAQVVLATVQVGVIFLGWYHVPIGTPMWAVLMIAAAPWGVVVLHVLAYCAPVFVRR